MDAPSKPALSLVVPSAATGFRRESVQALSPAKQKRLFPVACRVVPTDQWFTSRIDRTWNVIDLKLWLLSKALPPQTLPLPASFRPSSPVTFASAPPRPQTATSYHIPLPPSAPTSPAPSPSATPASPHSSVDEHDQYPLSDYGSLPDDPFDLEDDDDDLTRVTPRSIPYSFSTGAPSISGLDALKAKVTAARGYGVNAPGVDPELVTKAEAIARRWRVYSFSTGMLLADDLPLSEYGISPFELLELHRVNGYVRLPRTIHPLPCVSILSDDDALTDDAAPIQQSTARAYHSTTTRKPSPHAASEPDPSDSDDEGSPPSGINGSPYVQPYFDGWLWMLTGGASGDPASRVDAAGDVEGASARKMRRRARAKSEAARALKGKDRAHRDREWSELQKLLAPADGAVIDTPADRWHRRWVMVREGVLTVWKEKRDAKPEASYDIASCVALHDGEKIPSILGSSSSATIQSSVPSTSGSVPARPQCVICARFRSTSVPRRERKNPKPAKKGNYGTPTLVLQLPDKHTHEHLLRIFHRLAYSAAANAHATASSTHPHARTLRTDFLPNPIPHPLALSFSEPSPILPRDEGSPVFSSAADDTDDTSDTGGHRRPRPRGAGDWVGLGSGMGVRFPEWREYVLKRAIRAGQGFPVSDGWPPQASGTPAEDDPYGFTTSERPYLGGQDYDYDSSDADSDGLSEVEWDGWAYDLDRPHARTPEKKQKQARSGMKTPHGSPVSDPEPGRDLSQRRRAQSFVIETALVPSQPHSPSLSPPPSSSRLRASTVSSPTVDETASVHTRTYEAGRVRGLMRGLSMRAGRESFMRSLENALDFVEGK